MKLLTKEVEEAFKKFPLRSQDGKREEATVVCKFFDPCGRMTYYATEGEREGDDFIIYGWMVSPLGEDCDEWGYASVNELQAIRRPFGLGIERDINFPVATKTVREVLK